MSAKQQPSEPQVFRFTYREEEYWNIYMPTHDPNLSFFKRKPADIYWKMAVVAMICCPILFFSLPHIYQFITAIFTFFAFFFIIAGTILSLKADGPIRNIRTYYQHIEGGMTIKVLPSAISFETKQQKRLVNANQIKEARFQPHYVEFVFVEGPAVLFPISLSCKSLAEELENAVAQLAAKMWGKEGEAGSNPA